MALNKFMHPRNIYKNPPDFTKLAKSYEEFSGIVKHDVTGKVSIDFKNPHSLRILTKCLLKADFNLDVVIPEDRLVPTLPLRLNYILWIEDLLSSIQRSDNIWGLDIGTGACAIYPLLASVKNKWHMIGTETDEQSLQRAQENVEKNNLQELIQLKKNPTASVMEHSLAEEERKFDFSMCNPPFYSSIQELCESRSPARLPPKNGFTGSPQELITEGGELAFCRKMIEDSKKHKNKILIFTTMVGHKYNLKELEQDLKADGIKNTTTEFCQGRVTRWGLAWTYQDYDISQIVPPREKSRKKSTPVTYLLPQLADTPYDLDSVSKRIKCILQDLNIDHKVLNKRGSNLTLDIVARTNTWSNQRRKRRLMKRDETNDVKKPKMNIEDVNTSNGSMNLIHSIEVTTEDETVKQKINTKEVVSDTNGGNICKTLNCSNGVDTTEGGEELNGKCTSNENNELSVDTTSTQNAVNISDHKNYESISGSSEANTSVEYDRVAHAFVKIVKKDNDFILEMEFLDGTAGKEGLHQIIQYIKNNWK